MGKIYTSRNWHELYTNRLSMHPKANHATQWRIVKSLQKVHSHKVTYGHQSRRGRPWLLCCVSFDVIASQLRLRLPCCYRFTTERIASSPCGASCLLFDSRFLLADVAKCPDPWLADVITFRYEDYIFSCFQSRLCCRVPVQNLHISMPSCFYCARRSPQDKLSPCLSTHNMVKVSHR